MKTAVIPEKVRQVVREDLHAEVEQCVLTETDGTENIYVVLWTRYDECGTHRVCVLGNEAMCVWGHYHRGANRLADAYVDFNKRAAEGI